MTSTKWTTLTGFVEVFSHEFYNDFLIKNIIFSIKSKYLGKTGKCLVEHTEKGPLVQYIDRGPEAIKKRKEMAKREKEEKHALEFENKALKKFEESLKTERKDFEEEEELKEEAEETQKEKSEIITENAIKNIEISLKSKLFIVFFILLVFYY